MSNVRLYLRTILILAYHNFNSGCSDLAYYTSCATKDCEDLGVLFIGKGTFISFGQI